MQPVRPLVVPQPADGPPDLRLERHQVLVCPHLHPADCPQCILAAVCCVGGVPRVLIREVKAFGPRCCPWSGFLGSTPRPMTHSPGGAQTLFVGQVIDQAALHGLLNTIRDLGLPLLEVRRLEPGAASEAAP